MRTPTEALKEIRDRLTYFCLRTDGRYDPTWATELVGIIDEAVMDSHAINNAAALRKALKGIKQKSVYMCRTYTTPNSLTANLMELVALVNAALSEPARNCDRPECKDIRSAMQVYQRECCVDVGPCFERRPGAMREADWLLAPAAERKGEINGSK